MFEVPKTMLSLDNKGLTLAGEVLLAKSKKTPAIIPPRGYLPPPRASFMLDMEAQEERVLALLWVAYQQPIPEEIFVKLRKAVAHWNKGDYGLANLALAHVRLSEIDSDSLAKACMVERQLDWGLIEPGAILKRGGYNPDEPRDARGRWTTGGGSPSQFLPGVDTGNFTSPADDSDEDDDDNNNESSDDASDEGDLMPGVDLTGYDPSNEIPADAVLQHAGNGLPFYAPPNADFTQVYEYGESISPLPAGTDAPFLALADAYGGIFDYQRSNGVFYKEYSHASNYGVGILLNGAGYSREDSITIATSFGIVFHSTSPNRNEMNDWVGFGWDDAEAGLYR